MATKTSKYVFKTSDTKITIVVPITTLIRLKLFKYIMSFAIWVGGFNGYEFVNDISEEKQK